MAPKISGIISWSKPASLFQEAGGGFPQSDHLPAGPRGIPCQRPAFLFSAGAKVPLDPRDNKQHDNAGRYRKRGNAPVTEAECKADGTGKPHT